MTRLLVIARNDYFPAVNHSGQVNPPRVVSSPRGNLALSQFGKRAPLYDATAERWIVPPRGMTPCAGASAEPGQLSAEHTELSTSKPARPAVNPKSTAGHFKAAFLDFLLTMLGLTTFGAIAAFLMVLQ